MNKKAARTSSKSGADGVIVKEEMINFTAIEKKWQEKWEKAKCFAAKEDNSKKKFYVLEMYPYPSGSGLHIGHAFNYTLGDILARFKRMQGFNVLYPMGYDSFGLPAENAAIKNKSHPRKYTDEAIANFIRQQKSLGFSYDWSRKIESHDVEYYKWDQFFFLEFLKNGLAYRKKSPVNFCPECNSVLANEQVHNGKCWVHKDTDVEIKPLEQWFLKTTKYADELLQKITDLDWPERIKIMQENWIGKSHGTDIDFEINNEKWKIFTTRADTIYGVTFMVVSAQHPRLMELITKGQRKEVDAFLKKIKSTSEKDAAELEKEGAFTGSYAINPVTKDKIPVYTGNFVVADYGSGMVMAVPAHDQRDFEFAKKYKIPIKQVIAPSFILSGKEAPQKNVQTIERETVTAVIEHFKENKFLLLKEPGDFILVGGGIEKGETPEDAIKREIEEETGYRDFEIKKVLIENLFGFGFRRTKNVNQKAKDVVFYVKLKSGKQNKSEVDVGKHELIWLDRKEIANKITWEHHRFIWDLFNKGESAFVGEGVLVNSKEFNGTPSRDAIDEITSFLEKKKLGRKVVQYKLRDWLISRQRYWGTPIPIVYCDKCGVVPVNENELPVKLPEKVKFGVGNPLVTAKEWINVKCPKCHGQGRRETDTMDTFFESSWYFLRFCDNLNRKKAFDEDKASYWMPVDFYVGGAEHACMHLIYARFFTKVLRDLGYLNFGEPFKKLFNQGMVHGEDGAVMSKSRGNVIDPLTISGMYGADSLRLFLVSMASPDKDSVWSNTGLESMQRFLARTYNSLSGMKIGKTSDWMAHKINLSIKKITEYVSEIRYNLAVIELRNLFDNIENELADRDLKSLIKLLSLFAPHIAEELWEKMGEKGFVSTSKWPECDESKIDIKVEEAEKNMEKTVADVLNILKIVKEKQGKDGEKIYLYVIPNELGNYNAETLSKRLQKDVKVYAVNDKNKFDPEGKAGKAKPGKPGIFVE